MNSTRPDAPRRRDTRWMLGWVLLWLIVISLVAAGVLIVLLA